MFVARWLKGKLCQNLFQFSSKDMMLLAPFFRNNGLDNFTKQLAVTIRPGLYQF